MNKTLNRDLYYGPEIITPKQEIVINPTNPGKGYSKNTVKWRQTIQILCKDCDSVYSRNYGSHRLFMLKRLANNSDYIWKCHGCKVRENNIKYYKGKTLEERIGVERASTVKQKLGLKGAANPQYGKPAYQGGGNGWSGWYRGTYFRSIRELSFIVKYLDRFKFKYRTTEKKTDGIPYLDYRKKPRTYFPDFLVEDKFLVEIKPRALWNSQEVLNKKTAAVGYCQKNNYIYKIIDPITLSFPEIQKLYNEGDIVWLDRYQKKFNEFKKIHL